MGLFGKSKKNSEIEIGMIADGEVIKLEKVEDPVFSQKMMGDGFAVFPDNGIVKSPVSGVIQSVFPTGHALGITVNDDVEVLIHIGLDTVNLNGEGFKVKVNVGDEINLGDTLVEFEYDEVKSKVPSIITPVIFTKLEGHTFNVDYAKASAGDIIGKISK